MTVTPLLSFVVLKTFTHENGGGVQESEKSRIVCTCFKWPNILHV